MCIATFIINTNAVNVRKRVSLSLLEQIIKSSMLGTKLLSSKSADVLGGVNVKTTKKKKNNSRCQKKKHRIDFYRLLKALSHRREMTQRVQSPFPVTAAYNQTRWSPGKHKQRRALSSCQGTADRLTLCTWGRARLAAGKAEDIYFTH